MENQLMHHGIKGMRWGVRRTPEQLGYKNLKKAKTSNMDKWGKDPDHNVAYIGGYSGSGKTTVAKTLADKSTDIIHLDLYFEKGTGGSENRCKDFDSFLRKNKVKAPNELSTKEWTSKKRLGEFTEAIESFGREQHKKGRKIIAEGIQVVDKTIRPDKTFFADKPLILLSTSPVTSMRRAFDRDGRGNLLVGLKNLDSAKDYIAWYSRMHKRLDDVATQTYAKRGEEWVKNYLETL